MSELRVTLVIFLLAGCTEEKTTLTKVLARPDSVLSLTFGVRLAIATVAVKNAEPCPVFVGLGGAVDDVPATIVVNGGNVGTWLSPNCENASVTRERMPPLERGDEVRFTLSDRVDTVTAAFRRTSVESDVLMPEAFAGPGTSWRFSWPGALPSSVVFSGNGLDEAEVSAVDGGFTVAVPKSLGADWAIDLFIPTDVISECSVPQCRTTGVDLWSFGGTPDGGVFQTKRRFGGD